MEAVRGKMRAGAFLAWVAQQEGRYELASGEVVAMAPERLAHARCKALVWRTFDEAIGRAGLECIALPDGVAVVVADDTVYEPDALIRCGPALPPDTIRITDPVVVVEVLSPSTRARDAGAKLEDYFRIPSVVHYLLVKTDTHSVIHHCKAADGSISTRIASDGMLELTPPGITVAVTSFFPAPS